MNSKFKKAVEAARAEFKQGRQTACVEAILAALETATEPKPEPAPKVAKPKTAGKTTPAEPTKTA